MALAGLALAWVLACAQQGHWIQAAWAGLALVPHAPVLALEFFWASQVARQPSARCEMGSGADKVQPLPHTRQWLGAWWQEIGMGLRVFGWQQPWAQRTHADHLTTDALGRRGVLLVHGFYCNRGFWNTWMPRLRQAGIPFVAVTLGPTQAGIAEQARGIEAAVQRLKDLTGQAPLLVGHSMGGLVIRSWLAGQPDDIALPHEAITIGSPHHGTALARLARSPAAIDMRPGSDFLRQLMSRETEARRGRLTCYWSVCDNIVFPASTATIPGARNIAVSGRPHVGLAHATEIFEDVLQRLHRESFGSEPGQGEPS